MPTATSAIRFRVGADENGLGPRLGPMIVTAVLAKVHGDGWSVASSAPRGALAQRLGDSKQFMAYGDVGLGEAWARALVERGAGRTRDASSPDALIHALSLDDHETLQAPCPEHVTSQCWSSCEEAFETESGLTQALHEDLDRLAAQGIEFVAVRSIILCTRRLNDGAMAGKNRFLLDLHAMERLVLELRDLAGAEVAAVCGKVGGFGKYSSVFGPLGGRLHSVVEETRARSAYHFPELGEIAFVRDGDASDLCVALASMVGKYLREVLMGRIVRHYQGQLEGLSGASGYHDPVTAAFVDATRLVRDARNVPDACFERRSAEPPKAARRRS
ncbi:hypothetical protein [Chondromyces crocatus]|uniref:Uncharacterized protein n=1 Tax=Chondromyces crocatus TaxID=52 RepID=A0A0K1E663_CHOCO|nr:hypothetical protein [Chondromyces crocatus]AKT36167.1 uncharacterized protein CMC5_002810 [Chondromyces crocatus]